MFSRFKDIHDLRQLLWNHNTSLYKTHLGFVCKQCYRCFIFAWWSNYYVKIKNVLKLEKKNIYFKSLKVSDSLDIWNPISKLIVDQFKRHIFSSGIRWGKENLQRDLPAYAGNDFFKIKFLPKSDDEEEKFSSRLLNILEVDTSESLKLIINQKFLINENLIRADIR